MADELKPCPFCGKTDGSFMTDAGPPEKRGKWGWWECGCGARAEDVRTNYEVEGWQAAAIAAWNRRAEPRPPPSREEVARAIRLGRGCNATSEDIADAVLALIGGRE